MSNFTNEPTYKAYEVDILERNIGLLNEIIRLNQQRLKNGWGSADINKKEIEESQMDISRLTQRLNNISIQKAV